MSKRLISVAFPVIVAGTVILLAAYAAVQQDIRQSSNDPQIAMAEDAAAALSAGEVPASVVSRDIVDASQSLSPFVMVFDDHGLALESSARMGDALPKPPPGIFQYVAMNGEDRVTWQTPSGLRFATVVTEWKTASSTGFVLVARSIREAELRVSRLGWLMFCGWVAMVIGTILILGFGYVIGKKRE